MPRDIELADDCCCSLKLKQESGDAYLILDDDEFFVFDLNNATTLHAWLGEYIREDLTK